MPDGQHLYTLISSRTTISCLVRNKRVRPHIRLATFLACHGWPNRKRGWGNSLHLPWVSPSPEIHPQPLVLREPGHSQRVQWAALQNETIGVSVRVRFSVFSWTSSYVPSSTSVTCSINIPGDRACSTAGSSWQCHPTPSRSFRDSADAYSTSHCP